jgi:dCMP deaminase
MKQKYVNLYIDWATRVAELSHAKRLHVGAVIVKDDSVISYGYNGMPSGWDNDCEDENGLTKPEVLHAESNAISKLAKSHSSGKDSELFVTHSPCMECAKLIHQAGIKSVYYKEQYRSTDGLEFLKKSGVNVIAL